MKVYGFRGYRNLCGENIRKFREAKGLSQDNLVELVQREGLKLKKNNISRIEQGKRLVLDYEIYVFAKVLGVSMEDLQLDIPEYDQLVKRNND